MSSDQPKPRVIIRHRDAYEPQRIRVLVREALEELGLRPHGRTLLKPNIVMAGEGFEHAFTRPEFVEGVLLGLQDPAASYRSSRWASAAASRFRHATRSRPRAWRPWSSVCRA
jgi:hypothetical protein